MWYFFYNRYRILGYCRDWNTEIQHARDLPRNDVQERILRDRKVYCVQADFLDAARKGAMYNTVFITHIREVIDGNIPPINPTDGSKAFMYIYNNIFYSFALDGREYFKVLGNMIYSSYRDLVEIKQHIKLHLMNY